MVDSAVGNQIPKVGSKLRRPKAGPVTRHDIIVAAANLTLDCGVEGLSIKAVAKAVGVTPADVYGLFIDLDHLQLAVVSESVSLIRRTVEQCMASLDLDNAVTIISQVLDALRDATRAEPGLAQAVVCGRHSRNPLLRQAVLDAFESIRGDVTNQLRLSTRLANWRPDDLLASSAILILLGFNYVEMLLYCDAGSRREKQLTETTFRQFFVVAFGLDSFGAVYPHDAVLPTGDNDDSAMLPRVQK